MGHKPADEPAADPAGNATGHGGHAGDLGGIGGIGKDGSDPAANRSGDASDASHAPMPAPDADAGLQREVGDIGSDNPDDGSLPGRMGGGLAGG